MYLATIITDTDEMSLTQRLFTAKADALKWLDESAAKSKADKREAYGEEWVRDDIRNCEGEHFYLRCADDGSYVQTFFVEEIIPDDPTSMPTVGL